ncbi:hypothetical protein C7H79_13645 [Nitrosomonas supralitoralis]|uniref:Uncharacterized protein n=1 Tax=Nitrosomonas supralitoralis TaxID=2116706 RepID=A0A2P7NSF3_9PROT|nr:hypothetical protein C7H79_13645 [Nitrosomonas supralitoralis]
MQIPSGLHQCRGDIFGADIAFGKASFVVHAGGICFLFSINGFLISRKIQAFETANWGLKHISFKLAITMDFQSNIG